MSSTFVHFSPSFLILVLHWRLYFLIVLDKNLYLFRFKEKDYKDFFLIKMFMEIFTDSLYQDKEDPSYFHFQRLQSQYSLI